MGLSRVTLSDSSLSGRSAKSIMDRVLGGGSGRIPAEIVISPTTLLAMAGLSSGERASLPSTLNSLSREPKQITISMGSASQQEREAFLRRWTGRANTDNSRRVGERAYREAINGGATPQEAARVRDAAVIKAEQKVLRDFIEKNGKDFPNIKIK